MKIEIEPKESKWAALCTRPRPETSEISQQVVQILKQVKEEGDQAVIQLTEQFDRTTLQKIEIDPK